LAYYVAYAEADDSAGGYPGNDTRNAGFRDDSVAHRRWTRRRDAASGAEHVSGLHLADYNPGYGVAHAVILFPVIMFVARLQMRLFKQEGII
jgi:hypothetical protein